MHIIIGIGLLVVSFAAGILIGRVSKKTINSGKAMKDIVDTVTQIKL